MKTGKEQLRLLSLLKKHRNRNMKIIKTREQNVLNKHGLRRLGKDWRIRILRTAAF